MTLTSENIINSLAGVLKERYPEYPVYASPNQQGTDFPCFFIFFMPSSIESQIAGHFMRDLGIDIVFVQQRNITDGNEEILAVAEYLDERLELFRYLDGNGQADKKEDTAMIRTYERQWKIEDMELHYQFHIRKRVEASKGHIFMQEMEENNAYVKER